MGAFSNMRRGFSSSRKSAISGAVYSAKTLRKLGELLGLEEEGEAIASYCENTYNEILALMDEVGE